MTQPDYQVRPEEVLSVVGNITYILLDMYRIVEDIIGMDTAPTSYAPIGAPVSTQNIVMQGRTGTTLMKVLAVLKAAVDAANRVVADYKSMDGSIAASLGGGQPGYGSTGYPPSYGPTVQVRDHGYPVDPTDYPEGGGRTGSDIRQEGARDHRTDTGRDGGRTGSDIRQEGARDHRAETGRDQRPTVGDQRPTVGDGSSGQPPARTIEGRWAFEE